MTPLILALQAARARLLKRVEALGLRLDQGEEGAWPDYLAVLAVLVTVASESERAGPLVTTKELGARLGVSARTVRRRARAGQLASVSKIGARWRA